MSSLEKTAAAHSEEVITLQDSLATQKQLASKYSDRVSARNHQFQLTSSVLNCPTVVVFPYIVCTCTCTCTCTCMFTSGMHVQVSELEKDLRLKMLNLKDTQKELDTERVVSSKVYDEVRL